MSLPATRDAEWPDEPRRRFPIYESSAGTALSQRLRDYVLAVVLTLYGVWLVIMGLLIGQGDYWLAAALLVAGGVFAVWFREMAP